ncbi:hypothetical protein OHB12_32545 [Nocardia sp. NBC_01730]|nr:hypothetical protein OHB12_32545 [Nocardia sp. NBC_01730]
MTLRADLTALLADAGIVDVDIDEAVEDGHRPPQVLPWNGP